MNAIPALATASEQQAARLETVRYVQICLACDTPVNAGSPYPLAYTITVSPAVAKDGESERFSPDWFGAGC